MMGWLKTAAVLTMSLLLMGSKLIIRVPEGGAVVSSSGLFACDALETCTIAINQHHFAETFSAQPSQGYLFSHWENRAGALCSGSHSAYCDELDSGPFSNAGDRTVKAGGSYSLSPTFSGRSNAGDNAQFRYSVKSHQSTRYYAVSGTSREQIWSELTGPTNPLPVDRHTGTKPLGHASFKYQYNYQSAYTGGTSNCSVKEATFDFRFETVLPRLASAAEVPGDLSARWNSLSSRITEHEAGHHAIYRQLVSRLPEVLKDIGSTPCTELDGRVKQAVASAVEEIRRASENYDHYHSEETYAVTSL